MMMLIVTSCSDEEKVVDAPSLDVVLIDQPSSVFIQDATEFMEMVKVMKVPESVAVDQAASLNGFNYIDNRLYAHSTYLNSLLSFDENGDVIWLIKGSSSPVDVFRSADLINFDQYKNEFLVYDGIERTIFAYDLNGGFIRKELCEVNFMDFKMLKKSRVIYDASFLPNTHLQNSSQEFNLYIENTDGSLEALNPRLPLQQGLVPWNGNSNFISVGDNIYFKPNFGDTTFTVRYDDVSPYLITKFSSNNRAQSILDEIKTGSIARKIFSEQVPYTNIVVPTRFGNYATYTSGGKRFMYASVKNDHSRNDLNTQFLKFNETIIPVPISFSNGYFFSVAKEDDRDAILEVAKDKMLNSDEMEEKFEAMSKNIRDTEGLYIYVLKVK
ncbi:6-bladed beta-propeller [Neolewinella aurantiaca]|nr:6-bladed beta-propeller [Neolewinella aurantiaca]